MRSETETPWWLHDEDDPKFEMRDGWVVPKDSLDGCRGIVVGLLIGAIFWIALAIIIRAVTR